MDKTRKTAAIAAVVVAGRAIRRRKTNIHRNEPEVRGMCFRVASLADVDAGRDFECVLL